MISKYDILPRRFPPETQKPIDKTREPTQTVRAVTVFVRLVESGIIGARVELRSGRGSDVAAKSKIHQTPFPQQTPLPIKRYAAAYGVHPSTVWRALRDGRLQYIIVGRRKLILPPVVQSDNSSTNRPSGKK
jgi:hypothetical protein